VFQANCLTGLGISFCPTGRAIRLGVDRNDLVRAVEQGLEVFGGEFGVPAKTMRSGSVMGVLG
jgi:hypothetical protein